MIPLAFQNPSLPPRVLLVDDDAETLSLLAELLASEGYETSSAASVTALRALLAGPQPDVVLLDWRLPDGDGLEMLGEIKGRWPTTQVIMLTGYGTIDAAVEAVKRGAFHFQPKPFEVESLILLVQRACEHKRLSEEAEFLQRAVITLSCGFAPVFKSPAMKAVARLIERIAPSDAAVLITGESGTGKEVAADLLHALSNRAKGPLVKVNCAALPHELIESELFGAVRGSYTGAHVDREGLFRQAHGGTIFLDEISEMPLETQSKLLRVLQDKQYRPIGGKTILTADCRVVAATNRKPEDALREKKLREDLYYRINAVNVFLPPLRDRREDILPLANAFLQRFAAQAGRNLTGFSEAAIRRLIEHEWPGNVRQLENEVQRAVLLSETNVIEVSDLSFVEAGPVPAPMPVPMPAPGSPRSLEHTSLEALEREAILHALAQTGGNKAAAAKQLGVTRQTLYNKLQHFKLPA